MASPLFPLRAHHRASGRLQARACGVTASLHGALLYGRRALQWPAISLTTDTSMGPSRHALAQMVVAGTVTWLPSFPPPVTRRDPGPAPETPTPSSEA